MGTPKVDLRGGWPATGEGSEEQSPSAVLAGFDPEMSDAHDALPSWPWNLVGLASIELYPGLEDKESR